MAYIPQNAEWYVAELLDEITVEGDDRNVVHRNLVLVHATSPEDAYRRAIERGKQSESTYQTPGGRSVVIKFRGIKELDVVHDQLGDGAELKYVEEIFSPEGKIVGLVKVKEQLNVFREVKGSEGPEYGCKEIIDEAYRIIGQNPENRN